MRKSFAFVLAALMIVATLGGVYFAPYKCENECRTGRFQQCGHLYTIPCYGDGELLYTSHDIWGYDGFSGNGVALLFDSGTAEVEDDVVVAVH